jgi:hypothetical protein
MKWNHIMDKQPQHGESIVQVDAPYEGHYCMGMRDYYQKCTFEEYLDFCRNSNISFPDFWWVSAKEFPFPNQPERLSEKTPKGEAIV